MAVLYFSDILQKIGLEPKKVKLIRHSLSDEGFKTCFEHGMVFEYTRIQKRTFEKFDYWAVFIAVGSTNAKLFGLYKYCGSVPNTPDLMPANYPCPDMYDGKFRHHYLEPVDLLKEYEDRLIIDWGGATRSWHQNGSLPKPVVSIRDNYKVPFPGFAELTVTYPKLCNIVNMEAEEYSEWRAAMREVQAVYIIVDTAPESRENQYVGATYGSDGLLGRWRDYAKNGTGGNEGLIKLLKEHPERRDTLQFSVLQVLPKELHMDDIFKAESRWKRILGSRINGLNQN